jgi:ADP-ribose pyrophosphatase YjhB (NUDIX family)
MQELIQSIRAELGDSRTGLPEELFLFVSELTPMINVDLLVCNDQNQTLLTWRDDVFYGPGWHVPGGIIRFKERASHRIDQVAQIELGAEVEYEETPLRVTEIMNPTRDIRGHFISLLYRCKLKTELSEKTQFVKKHPENNHWAWFSTCPEDLIYQQEMYREFINPK